MIRLAMFLCLAAQTPPVEPPPVPVPSPVKPVVTERLVIVRVPEIRVIYVDRPVWPPTPTPAPPPTPPPGTPPGTIPAPIPPGPSVVPAPIQGASERPLTVAPGGHPDGLIYGTLVSGVADSRIDDTIAHFMPRLAGIPGSRRVDWLWNAVVSEIENTEFRGARSLNFEDKVSLWKRCKAVAKGYDR